MRDLLGPSVWHHIFHSLDAANAALFTKPLMERLWAFHGAEPLVWGAVAAATMLALLLSLASAVSAKHYLRQSYPQTLAKSIPYACIQLLARRHWFLLPTLAYTLAFFVIADIHAQFFSWLLLSRSLFLLGVFEMAVALLFSHQTALFRFTDWTPEASKKLYQVSLYLGLWCCAFLTARYLLQPELMAGNPLFLIGEIVFVAGLGALLSLFVRQLMIALAARFTLGATLRRLLSVALQGLLWFAVVTAALGYHQMAAILVHHIAFTLCLVLLTAVAMGVLRYYCPPRFKPKAAWQELLQKQVDGHHFAHWYEFSFLRFGLLTALGLLFAYLLIGIWEQGFLEEPAFSAYVRNGGAFADMVLHPFQLIFGFLIFTLLEIVNRSLQAAYLRRNARLEQGEREAYKTIISYIGHAVAALIGLMIAGVDFSSLAIVAGALSVGIGFGLQNIFNNFVSGLILLFERPIKVGDRIIVGHTEGTVKKISIRSTQIATLQLSDVIVPNSELITSQVTNMMFKDTYLRIYVEVGVSYNSDLEKVKRLLEETALQRPLISKNPEYKPLAFFVRFDDSNVVFKLACAIEEPMKRVLAQTDLAIAVFKALGENGIKINYPQLECTVKQGAEQV